MEEDNFVDKFVDECLDKGVSKTGEICELAVDEIDEIDEKIKDIHTLRVRRENLVKVLRNFNHDSIKSKGRKNKQPIVNEDIASIDSNPTFKPLIEKVCSEIAKVDIPLSAGVIINNVGYDSDPTNVYVVLKWLLDKGILSRDNKRALNKGPNWNDCKEITGN